MTLTQPPPVRTPGRANGVTPPSTARFEVPPWGLTTGRHRRAYGCRLPGKRPRRGHHGSDGSPASK
ncbi:hypothetical protein [Streptomyces albofaciens]|uniref:hypothetical protein n=1 Tax=Streptomyces albofaciens TaxID=66866 RepID=UPI00123B8C07|nr:hypothetical protein [Streptomyces albofaciens]